MRNKKIILFFVFSLFIIYFSNTHDFALSANVTDGQESLTVTTYYPAPRGTFKELRLEPTNDVICTVDSEGKLYYNDTTNQLDICSNTVINNTTTSIVSPLPGPGGNRCYYWDKSGINDIVNTNTGSVIMNNFQVGNANVTDMDLQINGRWVANTDNEVYPVMSPSSGTYWYAHYSTFGSQAITMGAYYGGKTYTFSNFVINDVPTCCGNVGIGTRFPRAKLHVAYPKGYAGASDSIFLVNNESSYGGTYNVGLVVERNTAKTTVGGWGGWGVSGKLSVLYDVFSRRYGQLAVRGHNYGMPVIIDSGGGPGSWVMWFRQYAAFNTYFDGQNNVWRTFGDTINNANGGAIMFSTQIMGDLGFKTIKSTGGTGQVFGFPIYNNPDLYISSWGPVSVGGTNSGGRQFYVNGLASGTNPWACTSDLRLKKNIKNLSNGLNKILNLRGVNFEWIDPTYGRQGKLMGVIAQEVNKFVPQAVSKQKNSYYVELDQFVPLLIQSAKEQQMQIADLKKELEEIKKLKTRR